MKVISIFLFEAKHFVRNPFKIVALVLFIIAGIYGLHSGASLYKAQQLQIEDILKTAEEDRQEVINYYKEGKKGPEGRSWVDVTTPFWAVWYTNIYHFKQPSPAMVYSVGQAEQYGYYKRVTFQSSPYDADMAEEISNPERLQTGTLDFSFAIIFLTPLLLLILIYNLKSYENEQGFLPLILVQSASKNSWLLVRMAFYFLLTFITMLILVIYGAILTNVFEAASMVFFEIVLLTFLYLVFWCVFYFIIIQNGKRILGNTLQMVGLYLLFTFVVPAAVHQWISIEKPVNLMTDFIDATRDKKQDLYKLPDSIVKAKLVKLFPEIANSKLAKDSLRSSSAMNYSFSALPNELMKESIAPIQKESIEKNKMIQSTYWFNPVIYFQHQFNKKAATNYQDYHAYREQIQAAIDFQLKIMVPDIYNDVKVDEKKYMNYIKQFIK